ncbi:hypothetical protein [Neolewinella sp.]|uniref:hypothetical protein n=1 Tax=Neolewinella sp. TaxID=2993543 RepID=UPI003B51E395
MRTRFKITLHRLKNQLSAGRRERRRLLATLRRREAHIARLTAQRDALQRRLAPTSVPNHHYPAEMIALAVFMVVQAGASLRCAAKTVAYFAGLMGWDYGQPRHATVDNWTRRLGLYALDHSERKTGQYVAIIDESIQIGCEKCLLLLGVKLSEQQAHCAALTHTEVEVLGVEVQRSWKADQVADFMTERLAYHADIDLQYVISDQDTNLLGAFAQRGLAAVADCSHVMMNALKKLLADHAPLRELTAFMGTYRRQHLLSQRSHLCPPTLRDKDRFLRVFVILDWVDRLGQYWPALPADHRQTLAYLERQPVVELLAVLRSLRAIITLASSLLKTSGISARSQQLWRDRVAHYRCSQTPPGIMAEELIAVIERYFQDHQHLLTGRDRLLCCSDIIEATFGYYKNKGGTQVISSDVLYLPLLALPIDLGLVTIGLKRVSQPMVQAWHEEHTCDNRYSMLRRLRGGAKTVTAPP